MACALVLLRAIAFAATVSVLLAFSVQDVNAEGSTTPAFFQDVSCDLLDGDDAGPYHISDPSKPIDGSLCPGDADLYSVDVCADCSFVVRLLFTHDVADLDLSVGANDMGLGSSDSVSDNEIVIVNDYAGGTVDIEAYHYSGSFAKYRLTVTISAPNCGEDDYEPNDSLQDAFLLSAAGTFVLGYTCEDDVIDLFNITLCPNCSLSVGLAFDSSKTDLDLYLFDDAGALLNRSASFSSTEHASFDNTQDSNQTVAILVFYYDGDSTSYLAGVSVDSSNVEQVTSTLRSQTQSTEFIGSEDVSSVIQVVESVGATVNSSLSSQSLVNISTSLTEVVDGLLAVDPEVVKKAEQQRTQSNSSASLPGVFGTTLNNIAKSLPPGTKQVSRRTRVATAAFNFKTATTPVEFPDQTYDSGETLCLDDNCTNDPLANTEVLSFQNLTLELIPSNPSRYYSFAVYETANLFVSDTVASESSQAGSNQPFISTAVVLAQSGDDTAFNGTIRYRVSKTTTGSGDTDQCVFWQFAAGSTTTGQWDTFGCQRTNNTMLPDSVVECECNHLTNFAVLTTSAATQLSSTDELALTVITYVGIAVSVPSLLITFIVFASYSALRTLGRIIIMHLCLNLAAAMLLLVFGADRTSNKDVCTGIAIALHYFLLTSFLWMLMEGINLYKMFVTVFDSVGSARGKHVRLAVISYVVPAVIVIVTGAVLGLDAYGTDDVCWLSYDNGALWAFLGPVCLIVAVNIVAFVLILRSVLGIGLSSSSNKTRTLLVRGFKISLCFFCVMGITWVFGILALTGDTAFLYLFTILNAFQGLFIFVFHCLRDKLVQDTVRGGKSQLPSFLTDSSQQHHHQHPHNSMPEHSTAATFVSNPKTETMDSTKAMPSEGVDTMMERSEAPTMETALVRPLNQGDRDSLHEEDEQDNDDNKSNLSDDKPVRGSGDDGGDGAWTSDAGTEQPQQQQQEAPVGFAAFAVEEAK
ncbi:hypothetical protein PTSG_06041 [Salpingoeca rosetta]|uniref:G-protein coupled receptors family 2 profile 2 domain-containing protein n=1 Tax=Salpingoeca rosetta (strain ATCC 50818 / BSB-021) TaxID=946362 RepID=F2UDI1_SALR5|nr:uncharacterized protein PTSG_06041 [Salpingoeca rosetta]EGD74676.1 hypothetical protein PTSG_06041 [Salpingoeca rosetta]|eukprot:XP_004992933.1 hypothetical protein PTSG_06041 [Salpingoeca rosetta]